MAMNDEPKMDRKKFPVMWGFLWFFAGVVGLWFVTRNGNIGGIDLNLILIYGAFVAANVLAFQWGWYWGGVYYEWWAGYVTVFISAVVLSVALWVLWYVNVYIPTTRPLARNESSTISAATISNLSASLFIVLMIPACYGAYWRQRHSFNQSKNRIAKASQSLETMQKLVISYGAILKALEADKKFISEDQLPASKLEIKQALITVARVAKSKGNISDLDALHKAYMFLAYFVPQQEVEIMDRFYNVLEKDDTSNERIADKIKEISKDTRYREIEKRTSEEFTRLYQEFDGEIAREVP
jgi:hypothetical protein